MQALTRHLETIAVALAIGAFAALTAGWPSAEGLVVLTGAALAFYYLASGVLVLLDRARVERLMRLVWFLGLWAVAMVVLGAMARVLDWPSAEGLLLTGAAGCVAAAGFGWLNRQGLDDELRAAYDAEMMPLGRRLFGALAVAGLFWFVG
jgi:hypothetical protein